MRKTKLFSLLAVLLCSATMWAGVAVNGKLPGAFSVSADKQVYFSQGNLQFTRTSTSEDWSTGTFSFMANQYDIIETGGFGIPPYAMDNYVYQTAIGLFGWATSNLNTAVANTYYYPWETDGSNYSNYGSGITEGNVNWSDNNNAFANYDWGTAMGSGWRTLTKDEWGYLFESRTGDKASTVNGTADIRFAMATVNGVKGVILFPNGGTFAADEFDAVGDLNHAGEEADFPPPPPLATSLNGVLWKPKVAFFCPLQEPASEYNLTTIRVVAIGLLQVLTRTKRTAWRSVIPICSINPTGGISVTRCAL